MLDSQRLTPAGYRACLHFGDTCALFRLDKSTVAPGGGAFVQEPFFLKISLLSSAFLWAVAISLPGHGRAAWIFLCGLFLALQIISPLRAVVGGAFWGPSLPELPAIFVGGPALFVIMPARHLRRRCAHAPPWNIAEA
ncbi:hypothetical protein ACFLQW_00970 [Candidatus Zixiibacteriota bacterium]